MSREPTTSHASDSVEQRAAEREILAVLEERLGVKLDGQPEIDQRLALDGYMESQPPICVEVFSRQGRTKPGQDGKLMKDMCKLLLVEKLLGKPARKILAFCDDEAVRSLQSSWRGRFAEQFGIECIVVCVSEETRAKIRAAQQRQFR